jgi:glycosyltransferase involved in cell wall biosynthesis
MSTPIRILHIIGKMDQGGIECLLMNLYKNIDRKLIQFDFLTHSHQPGFFDKTICSLGGKIHEVINPFSFKGLFLYRVQLKKFFKVHPEYTIIHSHMNTFSGLILSIAKSTGAKYLIAHSHTTIAKNNIKTPLWKLSRLLGQKAITHRFACSNDAAVSIFGEDADQTKIFKNSINIEKYKFSQKNRQQYRHKLNLKGKFVLGHVGRFNKVKNHEFLLDILYHLLKNKPESVLLLLGDGPLLNQMQSKAKSLGIEKSVIFFGNRDDVHKVLSAMDIFVFPSIKEGLGIVAIEAQTSGLPCVVSSGLPNEVKLNDNLEFINLKNGPKYWSKHIKQLQPSTQRQGAFNSVIKQGYDIQDSTKWLTKFYLDCINNYD